MSPIEPPNNNVQNNVLPPVQPVQNNPAPAQNNQPDKKPENVVIPDGNAGAAAERKFLAEQKKTELRPELKEREKQIREKQRREDLNRLLSEIRSEKDRLVKVAADDLAKRLESKQIPQRMSTIQCHQPPSGGSDFKLSLKGFENNDFQNLLNPQKAKPLNEADRRKLIEWLKVSESQNENQIAAKKLVNGSAADALRLTDEIAKQKNLTAAERSELVEEIEGAFRAVNKNGEADELIVLDALRRFDEDLAANPAIDRAALSRDYALDLLVSDPLVAARFLDRAAARAAQQIKTLPPDSAPAKSLAEYSEKARVLAENIRANKAIGEAERAEKAATEKFAQVAIQKLELTPEAKKDFAPVFRDAAIQALENVRADRAGASNRRIEDASSDVKRLFTRHWRELHSFEKLLGLNPARDVDRHNKAAIETFQDQIRRLAPNNDSSIKDISVLLLQKETVGKKTGAKPIGNFEGLDFAIARTRQQEDGSSITEFFAVTDNGRGGRLQKIDLAPNDILIRADARHLVSGAEPQKIEVMIGVGGCDKAERYTKLAQNYDALTKAEFLRHLHYRGDENRTLNGAALKNEIGQALGLVPNNVPQTEADKEALKEGGWNLYAGKELDAIKKIEAKIRKAAHGDPSGKQDVKMTVAPVFHDSEQTGSLVKISLFRVQSADGKTKFVEPVGSDERIYDSFDDWKNNTILPPGRLSYFENGQITCNPNGEPNVKVERDFKNGFWDKAGRAFDQIVVPVVGIAAAIGSFFPPTAPVAIPTLAAVSTYGAGRAGMKLYDMYAHDQSLNPLKSAEARGNMIDLGANVAGLRALRSAGRLATLAKELNAAEEAVIAAARANVGYEQFSAQALKAEKLSREVNAMAQIARGRAVFAQYMDTMAMGNTTVELMNKWDKLSGSDRIKAIGQIGFWGGMNAVNARRAGGIQNLYGLNDIQSAVKNFKQNSARTASALNESFKNFGADNRYFRPDVPDGIYSDPFLLRTMFGFGKNTLYIAEAGVRGYNRFRAQMKADYEPHLTSIEQLRMDLHLSKRYRVAGELNGFKPDETGLAAAHDKASSMMRPEILELRNQLTSPKAKEAFDVKFAETVSDPVRAKQSAEFRKQILENYGKSGRIDEQALIKNYESEIGAETARLQKLQIDFADELKHPNVAQAVAKRDRDFIFQIYEEYALKKADGVIKSRNFAEYLNGYKIPNSVGGNTQSLRERIFGFEKMSPAEQNRQILKAGDPDLFALYEAHLNGTGDKNLSHVFEAVDQILRGTHTSVRSFNKAHDADKSFANTRSTLSGMVNEAVAKSVRNYDDLVRVMKAFSSGENTLLQTKNTNRGSIFEEFYNQQLARNAGNPANDVRKPANLPATNGETQADRFIADQNTLVNLKSLGSGVGKDEILRDLALIREGRDQFSAQNGAIYDALVKLRQNARVAPPEGSPPLQYAYVQVTNGESGAKQAAQSTFERIRALPGGEKNLELFKVYYLDDNGVIHRLTSRDNSVRIGTTMNGESK